MSSANLTRYFQKIFASTAGTDQLSKFGSFQADPPGDLYDGSTINPDIIQDLSNYEEGLYAAVGGAYSPTIQDINSVLNGFSHQLAYVLQKGIPQWNAQTTYYIGNIVQLNGYCYASLTNSNLNHAVTNPAFWAQMPQNGVVTPNTTQNNIVVESGTTLTYPYMHIDAGKTVEVEANANLLVFESLIIDGMLLINGTCKVK